MKVIGFEKIMKNKKEDLTIKLSSEVQNQLKVFTKNLSDTINTIQQQLALFYKLIQPTIKQFAETYKQLPEIVKYVLTGLAERGWFISMFIDLPDIYNLAELIQNQKNDEIDDFMCNFIESELSEISKAVSEKFPDRNRIIKLAFKAHKRKEYELSVPVFLIQADGICLDILGENLYSRKNGKPKTESIVRNLKTSQLMNAFLEPLKKPNLLNARKSESNIFSEILNRNKILHGEMINYGKKINSLKTISLLNYLTLDVYNAKKQNNKNNIIIHRK